MELITDTPEATRELAQVVGESLSGGELLALTGELGSGKTVFVQGLARGLSLAEEGEVTSPTFVLFRLYPAPPGRPGLAHLDAYRLRSAAELRELGWEELLASGVAVVLEWADRVRACLPAEYLSVELVIESPERRRIRLLPRGARYEKLLARLAGKLARRPSLCP